jgi:hypothetical protein
MTEPSGTPRTDAVAERLDYSAVNDECRCTSCTFRNHARDLERELADAINRLSEAVDERDALKRRLAAMFPLFQEARDALTAIPLASAKLHGIRLDLADRMDDVGVPDRWKAREEAAQ